MELPEWLHQTTLGYDSFGELTSRTDAAGHTTKFLYSGAGDLATITDALGNAATLAYDGDGRPISVTDPNQHTATSEYDALERLIEVSDPLGNLTKFSYDSIGNLVTLTDANEHKTTYAYDAVSNLASVTDALGHVTRYAYDADNNRVRFTNAKGNATSYQYDALNHLTAAVDPLGFTTAYIYDPVGNVSSVTDAKSQTNHFTYDALNRLTSIAYADKKNVAYAYDADGNRTSMIDWTGTTSYNYDALDRLSSVEVPGNKTVEYTYDPDSRRATLIYPDLKSVAFTYDEDERLSTVTDWLSHATQYAYDAAGNLASVKYPNSASIEYAYDNANRLLSVVNKTRGVPPLSFDYTLDAVGNRTVVKEGGIPTAYRYDSLNELTSAETWFFKTTWSYDAAGNRVNETSPFGVTNYTYDASDRLLKAGGRAFTYDANGNQTSVSDAFTHLRRDYKWNAANRLISVDDGHRVDFAYDGDGNRVSQSHEERTQNYVNDVAASLPVVLQDDTDRGPSSSYVYGLNLIEGFHRDHNDFYQYDGLGSVIQLTDAAGRPKVSYAYDAWGNSILPTPPTNPFRFAGQALDAAAGLYYMRARYYDPAVGRFISRDAFPGYASSSSSLLNRYAYAMSNPVAQVDPHGLFSWSSVTNGINAGAVELGAAGWFSLSTVASGYTELANQLLGGRLQAVDTFVNNVQQAAAVTMIEAGSQVSGIEMSRQDVVENAKFIDFAGNTTGAIPSVADLAEGVRNISQLQNAIQVNSTLGDSILGPALAQAWQILKAIGNSWQLGNDVVDLVRTQPNANVENANVCSQ